MTFKVRTTDTILLTNRVLVLKAKNKKELEEYLKKNFPNDKVLYIEKQED